MKRAGFTMIELIFVIVILGILAAVAVPKLNATRDDAKAAKAAQEIGAAVTDVGSYYVARGSFGAVADMTNVSFSGELNASGTGDYAVNTTADCVNFETTSDGNLTVTFGTATGDNLCSQVQAALSANDVNKTHQFGGSSVTY